MLRVFFFLFLLSALPGKVVSSRSENKVSSLAFLKQTANVSLLRYNFVQSDENAYPECKSMWQKKKDGNQTVTPFSFYIYFWKQHNYV